MKLECFGSDKPLSIEIHQDEQKQAGIDHLEDSYEQTRRLKQERLDFEREYLSKSETYRSELAQSELSSHNLNAEHKKYQGESKRVMLSMHDRANTLVRKINKEASAVKQKFGVTYPFESDVDEPEWTGLNLSLRQAPNPAKFGLDSPVP